MTAGAGILGGEDELTGGLGVADVDTGLGVGVDVVDNGVELGILGVGTDLDAVDFQVVLIENIAVFVQAVALASTSLPSAST